MTEELKTIYNKKIQSHQEISKDLLNDLETNFKFLSKTNDIYNPYTLNYDNIVNYTSNDTLNELENLKSKSKILVDKLNNEYNNLLTNYKGTNTSAIDNVNKLNKNYVQLADIFATYYLLKLFVVLYIHIQTRIIVLKSNELNLTRNSCSKSNANVQAKENELQQLKNLLEEYKNKNTELSLQLQQRNSNLSNTKIKYESILENLTNEKLDLENKIKEKELELNSKKRDFNSNSSTKNTKISNLSSSLNNLTKELNDLKIKLEQKENELLKHTQNSNSNISRRETEFRELQNKYDNLFKENDNLKKQNNDLKNFLNDILPLLSNFALNNNT